MRVAGVNVPVQKHLAIGLTAIYGIGRKRALAVCAAAGIDSARKGKDLTEDEWELIRKAVAHFKVEGELRREVSMHIKRLKDIRCYRGIRHARGLPVRGQRTRTNARTRKGKSKSVVGSGKKKA